MGDGTLIVSIANVVLMKNGTIITIQIYILRECQSEILTLIMDTRKILRIGDVSDNGQVTIIDEDRLCYLVKSESRGSIGLRTISKSLLDEYVHYFAEHPDSNANTARDILCGKTEIDKFEYGYTSTLTVMAKMVLEYEKIQNASIDIAGNKKELSQNYQQIFYGAPGTEYIRSYLTALRTKPFMLLAGISGTGKSRIVRKLAQATTTQKYENDEDRWKDNRPENFELIQVKPNWHNSMDVVGFYSNISKKYEFTPFVEFIVKAWQHQDTPYFLCLDEMNLAPVEEYFAEFLSAIESRSTDENGEYITDPIIKPFKKFGEKEGKAMLIHLLGDADPIDKNPIAIRFYEKGLTLPPNLMVMGTVNMDETTFSFSRKVLDRAMSVEMNEVDYDKFLSGESEQFPLLIEMNELLVNRPQRAAEVTEEIESDKVIAYLKDVNTLMKGTPFMLGYRAANEAMLYVAAYKKFAGSDYALPKALDEFTLMKILSRIEGDDSRLGIADDDPRIATLGIETSEQHTSLLTCLKAIVQKHIETSSETEKKIDEMCNTLEREHFVSYWA